MDATQNGKGARNEGRCILATLIETTLTELAVAECQDEIRACNVAAAWDGCESAARALLTYWSL
jgi:hypothetical protein